MRLGRAAIEALTPEERVLYYRIRMLGGTTRWIESFSGPKDVVSNAVWECFAMQARILMEVLRVPRLPRERCRDVRAEAFLAPGIRWTPPQDPRLPEWLDQCDRAAGHGTTGEKPDWDEPEITRTLLAEVRKLAESQDARMSPTLKAWIAAQADDFK